MAQPKKTQALQLAEDALEAEKIKDPEKFWHNLVRASGIKSLQNEGKLLTQLFALAPVQNDEVEALFGDPILRHYASLGSSYRIPQDILKSFPKEALRLRRELTLSIDQARLLLEGLKNHDFVRALSFDPELYEASMGQHLFEVLNKEHGDWRILDVLGQLPDFRKAFLAHLLPRLTHIYDDLFYHKEFLGKLSEEERERLAMWVLTQKQIDFKKVWAFSNDSLSSEARERVRQAIRATIQKVLEERTSKDPVEAYLDGQISWTELEFAHVDPTGFRQYQLQGRHHHPFFFMHMPPWR